MTTPLNKIGLAEILNFDEMLKTEHGDSAAIKAKYWQETIAPRHLILRHSQDLTAPDPVAAHLAAEKRRLVFSFGTYFVLEYSEPGQVFIDTKDNFLLGKTHNFINLS